MEYIRDVILIILILGLYGRIYWMRREMDAIRLGIDASHDFLFDFMDGLTDEGEDNISEIDMWDNA
jgi:hypothetical protein